MVLPGVDYLIPRTGSAVFSLRVTQGMFLLIALHASLNQ